MTLNLQSSLHSKSPTPSSQICELTLQNFRCFAYKKLEIVQPQVLIIGPNGAGKSSLLEAVYYASYSHSFRTRITRQMVKEGEQAFNINLNLKTATGERHEIFVGFCPPKKLVKIDGVNAGSHAEMAAVFTTATLTQEDMSLVSDGPENRRNFLNQAQFLTDPRWLELSKKYKKNLEHRSALFYHKSQDAESLKIWTLQHWQITRQIQLWRKNFVHNLQIQAAELVKQYFPEVAEKIVIRYQPSLDCTAKEFDEFYSAAQQDLLPKEMLMGRTLFGAHLDDLTVQIYGRCARNFASRGEQKLLTAILKCAALQLVRATGTNIGCLLIDDFLTDLDAARVEKCKEMLGTLNTQTIITMPILRRDIFAKNSWTQEIIFE